MASIDFPFGDANVVQETVDEVKSLSDESLVADKGVTDARRSAEALAAAHKDNITALEGLPLSISEFAKVGSLFSRWPSPYLLA